MTILRPRWPHGAPCWATLASSDEARARAFYADVLGWSFRDVGPRQHDWVLAEAADGVVAGIGAVPEDGRSTWLLGFATDDLERSAALVVNAGGTLLQPPHEVLAGAARLAVGRGRGGMRFAMLEAGDFTGFTAVNSPGALVWEDGYSTAPAEDKAFHAEVFGWQYTPEPRAGEQYAMFGAPGDPRPWGGIGALPADLLPLSGQGGLWCLWFGVDSADAAVDHVITGGGGVLSGPTDTPWGRLALVQDPEGAVFGVVAPDYDDLPDRA